jgi:flagellar hook-associated protein 2
VQTDSSNLKSWYDETNGKIMIENGDGGPSALNIEGDNDLINLLGLDSGLYESGTSSEIEISLDEGNTISKTINSWNNSFEYNGLNIKAKNQSTDWVSISVSQDSEKTYNKIDEFVQKYNETMEFLYEKMNENKITDKSEEDMTEEEKMKGMLKGDSNLEKIFYDIRNIMYNVSDNNSLKYKSLPEIGITSGDTGKSFDRTMKGLLSINETELKNIINQNPEEVWSLFASVNSNESKSGITTRLKDYLWNSTKFGGFIDNVSGSSGTIGKQMKNISKEMIDLMDQLQRKEYRYVQMFSAMEQSISRMNSQMSFMMSRLGNQ